MHEPEGGGASPAPNEATALLRRMATGDGEAADELLAVLYSELRKIAQHHMRDQAPGHTLQSTALVNEAVLKLLRVNPEDWESRRHFLRVASRAMRNVLVDHARQKKAAKRGGEQEPVQLQEAFAAFEDAVPDLVELDEALQRLEAMDSRLARVVELRFFGGLTIEETARTLDVTTRTVERAWATARTWLRAELEDPEQG